MDGLYVNEVSLQGQFLDNVSDFIDLVKALVRVQHKLRSAGFSLRVSKNFLQMPVTAETLHSVIQQNDDQQLKRAMLEWLGKSGPFVENDRTPETDDYFECQGIAVTDGGLGEAARRTKSGQLVVSFSFLGGGCDFSGNPLYVRHGLIEEPLGEYRFPNYVQPDDLEAVALIQIPPPTSWKDMVVVARERFPYLILPDTLYSDKAIKRRPFSATIRDAAFGLMRVLDQYMQYRDVSGTENPDAREIVENYMTGERAIFSPESDSNKSEFKNKLTFVDPSEPGKRILAEWHGKISHQYFRMHFEWPVPADQNRLKILYLGPKLTKK